MDQDVSGEPEEMLTPSEVGAMFRVDPKTVTRWAETGIIPYTRTMGGHRRYPKARMLENSTSSLSALNW